jgi:hypothetical protein
MQLAGLGWRRLSHHSIPGRSRCDSRLFRKLSVTRTVPDLRLGPDVETCLEQKPRPHPCGA